MVHSHMSVCLFVGDCSEGRAQGVTDLCFGLLVCNGVLGMILPSGGWKRQSEAERVLKGVLAGVALLPRATTTEVESRPYLWYLPPDRKTSRINPYSTTYVDHCFRPKIASSRLVLHDRSEEDRIASITNSRLSEVTVCSCNAFKHHLVPPYCTSASVLPCGLKIPQKSTPPAMATQQLHIDTKIVSQAMMKLPASVNHLLVISERWSSH